MNNNSRSVTKNAVTHKSATTAKKEATTQSPVCDKRLYPEESGFLPAERVAVGAVILSEDDIEYNTCRRVVTLRVRNTGDRPIQVGSHFHFFEVNRYLEFDREAAFGMHLNIPATTAIRFEPGDEKEVELVEYSGKRRVIGFNSLVSGYTGREDEPTYYPRHAHALRTMHKAGFKDEKKRCKTDKGDCSSAQK